MMISNEFPGDNNEVLKFVQADYYGDALRHLFAACKKRYQASAIFVGVRTALFERLGPINLFDHHALQRVHDRIAAYYRYRFDKRGQMPFEARNLEQWKQQLLQQWIWFIQEEAARLAKDDLIARAILVAVAFDNTEAGLEAQRELDSLLGERYPLSEQFEGT
jgi:hypothetical protein